MKITGNTFLIFAAFLVFCGVAASIAKDSVSAFASERYFVRKVIDGDTLILGNGKHVRLLGINAPEVENSGDVRQASGISRITMES